MKCVKPPVEAVLPAARSGDLALGEYAEPPPTSRLKLERRSEGEIRQEERRRIGRELHDSTAQLLVALQLRMAYLKQLLGNTDCSSALSDIDATLEELHQEIRAVILPDRELPLQAGQLSAALQAMAERFARMTGLSISIDADPRHAPRSADIESSLYRIVQEALANVWRHARATRASITLSATASSLRMVIEDDGVGIAGTDVRRSSDGTGLCNIRDRVRQLGGRLYIRRLCRGTRLTVVISAPVAVQFARQ